MTVHYEGVNVNYMDIMLPTKQLEYSNFG